MCQHPAGTLIIDEIVIDNQIIAEGSTDGYVRDLAVSQMHKIVKCVCAQCGEKVVLETVDKPVEHGDWSKCIYM